MAAVEDFPAASSSDEEDDPVVRELDVYVCNEFLGSGSQLYLFQHPLRPPWRPYDYGNVDTVKIKPNARRVEVDLPLDTQSANYNDIVEDYKKVKKVTLRSSVVEPKATLAVGTVQGGRLLLAPMDVCVQLRPNLSHLNVGNQKKGRGGAEEEEEEEEDEPSMVAVEVQVQKRETEWQQQKRLNSYSYITQKEEEEQWKELALHTADTKMAESIWQRYMTPQLARELVVDLDRRSYLRSFVPTELQVGAAPSASAGPSGGLGGGDTGAGGSYGPDGEYVLERMGEAATKALPLALQLLFQKHPVCSNPNIRQWLSDTAINPQAGGPAREAAALTDKALHEAVLGSGLNVAAVRRMYVLGATGNAATDPLRKVVLELLGEKESFKRAELVDLARTRGIPDDKITDTVYNKVVKELCTSRGFLWSIKNGADM